MITINRKEFKKDPLFGKLHQELAKKMEIPDYIKKTLIEKQHIKDVCVEAKFFVVLPSKPDIYISYDAAFWYRKRKAVGRIEKIHVYDSFMEYETLRMKGLHGAEDSDIPNIN